MKAKRYTFHLSEDLASQYRQIGGLKWLKSEIEKERSRRWLEKWSKTARDPYDMGELIDAISPEETPFRRLTKQ